MSIGIAILSLSLAAQEDLKPGLVGEYYHTGERGLEVRRGGQGQG